MTAPPIPQRCKPTEPKGSHSAKAKDSPNAQPSTRRRFPSDYDRKEDVWFPRVSSPLWDLSCGGDGEEAAIHRIVVEAKDKSLFSAELRNGLRDVNSRYHLSAIRANLLRPFQHLFGSRVLEIGAGCGALTRFLGECGGTILAIEENPWRARIAGARTSDLANVSVLCETIDHVGREEKFDVVLAIGEFASVFSSGKNIPDCSFLDHVLRVLSDPGVLILATENPLGLASLDGRGEDHIGAPYLGANNSFTHLSPRTFGLIELQALLKASGLANQRLFLPLPNHKFPISIISDVGLDDPRFDVKPFLAQSVVVDLQRPESVSFSLEQAWSLAVRNRLAQPLANSFLIVAGRNAGSATAATAPDCLAWHYSADRHPAFAKETRFLKINDDIVVEKNRISSADKPNVPLENRLDESAYIKGASYWLELVDVVNRPGWSARDIAEWSKDWINLLAQKTGGLPFNSRSFFDPVSGDLLDATPFNCIRDAKGNLQLIDQEWMAQSSLELGYILSRGLRDSIMRVTSYAEPAPATPKFLHPLVMAVFSELGLSPANFDLDRFAYLDQRIQRWVAGRSAEQVDYEAIDALWRKRLNIRGLDRVSVTEANTATQPASQDLARRLDETSARAINLEEVRLGLARELAAGHVNAVHAVNRIAGLEAHVTGLEAARADLTRQLAQATQQASASEAAAALAKAEAAAQVAGLEAAPADLTRQLVQATQQANASEAAAAALAKAVAEAQAGLAAGHANAVHAENRIAGLEGQVADLEAARADLTRQLAQATQQANASEATAAALAKAVAEDERTISAEHRVAGLVDRRMAELEAREEATRRLVSQLSREIDASINNRHEFRAIEPVLSDLSGSLKKLNDLTDSMVIVSDLNRANKGLTKRTGLKGLLSRVHELLPRSTRGKVRKLVELSPTAANLMTTTVTQFRHVQAIRESGLFDDSFYALSAEASAAGDPILHYLESGEARGFAPSANFDPVYYAQRNPDVVRANVNCLAHYVMMGQREGRRPLPLASDFQWPRWRSDTTRETVLLFIHEATRTGAPIIGWNVARKLGERFNVVVVLLQGGVLTTDFEEVAAAVVQLSPGSAGWNYVEADYFVRRMVSIYAPKFAILNSASCRFFAPALGKSFVPVISLVHEFSSFYNPLGVLEPLYQWSSTVIFPADLVAQSSAKDYHILKGRHVLTIPQGACEPPGQKLPIHGRTPRTRKLDETKNFASPNALPKPLWADGWEDAFLVVGIGSVDFRKGVDVFLATAAEVSVLSPGHKIRFAWIGAGYNPTTDVYSSYLAEQIARSGLDDIVMMIDELSDLEPVYRTANLFYLSSRLDPQPNVAIDAALKGIPVVCFENATGMGELLQTNKSLRNLVVPYLDSHAAAVKIIELSTNKRTRAILSSKISVLGRSKFDMNRYVRRIIEEGETASRAASQQKRDFDQILRSDAFDFEFYLGPEAISSSAPTALRHYLAQSTLLDVHRAPVWGITVRRPMPGFHPLKYACECTSYSEDTLENPLAHYLNAGQPTGPWKHEVIRPNGVHPGSVPSLRVALHAHFHYPELLPDLLARLKVNELRCDLVITTTSEEKRRQVAEGIASYEVRGVQVRTVPNRGRDIGAFLAELADGVLAEYDIVGHVHGKRSPHTIHDPTAGDVWREFLWQNLIGAKHPMADIIAHRFAEDPLLGLVFPEDPHLVGWDKNRLIAEELASRLKLSELLPIHLDLPVGTMFWARPEALAPLLKLGLTWEDYPEEPVPIDGTILHALERLIPFVAAKAGYRYATTRVPGVER